MKSKMDNKENKLTGNFILYFIGNFGSSICLMLIVPLYTYYVKPEELGIYDLAYTAVCLLAPIAILSIQEGMYRWLLTSNKDEIKCINIISYSVKTAIAGLAISVLFLYAAMYFIKYEYRNYFITLLAVQCIYMLLREVSRGMQHIGFYVISGLLYTVLFLINTVLFLCILNQGLKGLFSALVMSYLIVDICILIKEKIIVKSIFSKKAYNNSYNGIIRYSLSLIINNISWWITNYSDRYMIKIFLNTYSNGIYSVASKYPSALSMLTSVFYNAWTEEAILYYDKEDRDEYYSNVFNNYALILLSFSIVLQPLSKLFILFTMDSSYYVSGNYVGFLYLGCVFQALSAFYGAGYLAAKETKSVMWTTTFAALLNILINLVFMKNFGLQIAGISTFAAYFTIWVIRTFHSKRYFNIKVNWTMIIIFTAVNLITASVLKYMGIYACIIISVLSIFVAIYINKKTIISLIKKFKKSDASV